MTGKDIFKIWAPYKEKWVDWVRPVMFISIDDNEFRGAELYEFDIPLINYLKKYKENMAIILDLPEHYSINEGIALAKIGYRPIPIYNGTNETVNSKPIVDNHSIKTALYFGAKELEKIKISKDAAPVFLLDSNRTNRVKKSPFMFDNSWDIYSQDIPSAEYFLKNGITQILVRGNKLQKDLNKVLYKFQEKGIEILFTNGYEDPEKVKLSKPRKTKYDF